MPQDRHREIVEIAQNLIENDGCAAVTMAQIASAAGMTEAGLYYWFPSKSQLLGAVVAPLLDAIDDLLEGSQTVRDKTDLLTAYASILVTHRNIARICENDLLNLQRIEEIATRLDTQTNRLRATVAGTNPSDEDLIRASAIIGALRRPVLVLDEPPDPAIVNGIVDELVSLLST